MVEGGVGQAIVEPVADVEFVRAGAGPRGGELVLGGGQSEAGDRDAEPLGEAGGGGAVAAADVDETSPGRGREPLADQIGERLDRLGGAFAAGAPEAVMDMLAPDRAVDRIELVIMAGDVGLGLMAASGTIIGSVMAEAGRGGKGGSFETHSRQARCSSDER